MRSSRSLLALLASFALFAAACGNDGGELGAAPGDVAEESGADDTPEAEAAGDTEEGLTGELVGAGATFPTPVFQDWIFDYQETRQPDVSINYQSIGSGGGIEQFIGQTVDFGSSERFLDDDGVSESQEARGCDPIQIPVLFGAVVIAFNDDQFDGLVLDADTIAGIFQREITSFDDERIAALNPDLDLPAEDIIPVHRSDGSGTTSVFTEYLDNHTDVWELGAGTEVNWPAGTVGGQGNEGVTAGIQQNPGGLGYINQAYAIESDLPVARVVNEDGEAIEPTLEATTEAVESVDVPDDFRFNIFDVGGEGYPIAGTNWVFVWECGYDENTEALLKDFWSWATQSDEADQLAVDLGYAPLGEGLKADVQAAIDRINAEG